MVAKSRRSRRICATVRVISRKDGRAVDSSNQRTPRRIFRRTIPMFGHTASERLALLFLRCEQTILCLIRAMQLVDHFSLLSSFLRFNKRSSRFRSLDRADPIHKASHNQRYIIQYTKHLCAVDHSPFNGTRNWL